MFSRIVRSKIIPPLASVLTSRRLRNGRRIASELKRRLTMTPRNARIYLRIDDPYSALLASVLPGLASRFRVEFELRAVARLPEVMTPERERLAAWARLDATRLAVLYDLDAPGPRRNKAEVSRGALALAEACQDGVGAAAEIFRRWNRGEELPALSSSAAAEASLRTAEGELDSNGHYMSAMVDYGGEWYWGLDRLNHLERRWIDADVARSADAEPHFVRRFRFLEEPAQVLLDPPPLIAYWSGRSPYSVLALERAETLCAAFGVRLEIRPVLPMVMRNLAVPRKKRFYILLDAAREADWLSIPFGRVCDPLGSGIERCYGVFDFARASGSEIRWAVEFGRAVWSDGVDASSDAGIREIATRARLDPEQCVAAATSDSWRGWAERHRLEMLDGGLWGVPSFRFGDTWAWGQDRFWTLETAMRACRVR